MSADYTKITRTKAIGLLTRALELAKAGERDPAVVAANELGVLFGGRVWTCAYAVRIAAKVALRRSQAPLTSQRVLKKAIELLNNGWGSHGSERASSTHRA